MAKNEIEITPEDWARAREFLERDPREAFLETVARSEARERLKREEAERRRRRINRLSFGLLARG